MKKILVVLFCLLCLSGYSAAWDTYTILCPLRPEFQTLALLGSGLLVAAGITALTHNNNDTAWE